MNELKKSKTNLPETKNDNLKNLKSLNIYKHIQTYMSISIYLKIQIHTNIISEGNYIFKIPKGKILANENGFVYKLNAFR